MRNSILGILSLAMLAGGCSGAYGTPGRPRAGVSLLAPAHPLPGDLATKSPVRLILVGDTGEGSPERASIARAIRTEPGDLIVILGDLVYPRGPLCAGDTLNAKARKKLEELLDEPYGGLGRPVLLVLGNHDVERGIVIPKGDLRRRPRTDQEVCYYLYARERQGAGFILPARHYGVKLGPATLSLVTSTKTFLDDSAATMSRALFDERSSDWNIIVTHHVYKTFHDKKGEQHLKNWIESHRLSADLVLNGHAHFLQMGRYGDVLAITSGGGAKEREQVKCAIDTADAAACGEGEYFGYSGGYGYAVLELSPDDMRVVFKDKRGQPLWGCRALRPEKRCEPDRP